MGNAGVGVIWLGVRGCGLHSDIPVGMVDELHVDRCLIKSVHRSHLDSASGAGNRDDISDIGI